MKILWVTLLVVLILLVQSEAKKKPKGKSCLKDDPKLEYKVAMHKNTRYDKVTEMKKGKGKEKDKLVPVADQPCWWDLSRSDCAKCTNGGVQCGFPMHKWCQPKKKKQIGCKGIPSNKYTLSSKGYPCYWNPKSTDCAWCLNGKVQCGASKADKCGNMCKKETDMKCDGVLTTCNNIPKCGFGASCDQKTKECKCGKGLFGNGFLCFDKETGEAAPNPSGNVDISIESASQFFVFPNGSPEFPIAI